jgi:signal peptidase I
MMPSFRSGDHVLLSRAAYSKGSPARGDVVIVRDPRDLHRRSLKRVVGLPGEAVRLFDGMLLIEGAHLEEAYLGGLPASLGLGDTSWNLGDDEWFVMGDNRARSTDSREFGPISLGRVVGKVWFRLWPLSRWGRVG